MTDSGLNQRLRQRSRRSGLMIGVSMVVTLMVCVAAFTMIYAKLEPVVSDFVGQGDIVIPTAVPTQVPPTSEPKAETTTDAATEEVAGGGDNQADIEKTATDEFVPDYQTAAGRPVNLRPGPGVASGEAITAVPDNSPLMYLGESQETDDPEGDGMETGQEWMKFRTEDGEEGWMREIDVEEYTP